MNATNIEIKAKCTDIEKIRSILNTKQARFVGIDHQIDTYFNVNKGRLKLREGNIENALIHYKRANNAGPKKSEVILYKSAPNSSLKELLTASVGIKTIVDKHRSIYFIDNVKFHLDQVKNLGTFVEIEAIDMDGSRNEEELEAQCKHYLQLFEIKKEDLLKESYSDLIALSVDQD
jgi:predicted adenylyl cyclase CyaB